MTSQYPDPDHLSCDAAGPRGFVIRAVSRVPARGAALLAVIVFIMIGSLAVAASLTLMGARLQQAERLEAGVQRHVSWGNTRAINQQYAFTWAMRDDVTRPLSTATLTGWGGSDADSFTSLQAFRSTVRPSNASANSYPFNNLQNLPTSDNGVYFVRTTGDSDGSQVEHISLFNYLKTYSSTLLGDLLIAHKAAGSGGYSVSDSLQVNGRVVVWDSSANVSAVRATACLNMTKTGTNTVKSTAASPVTILPQNFPASVRVTSGYGGTGTPYAVSDGSLNLIDNTDFTPGSVRHIMEATGTLGTTWVNCATGSTNSTRISTNQSNGSSSSATQTKLESNPTYALPTTPPYNISQGGSSHRVLYVRLKNGALRHLRIVNGLDQLVLEGQTNTTDYTAAALLPPVIIWLADNGCRDIRFVGENSRPLILATGSGNGATIYSAWSGTSLVSGGPLRWRLHWINEERAVYMHAPTGVNVLLTGGIRTDWLLTDTDSTSNVRFTLQRDTTPGALETMLPRDGWLEPYFLVQ